MEQDNKMLNEIPLSFAGETSTFSGHMSLSAAGKFELVVLAMDSPNVNFGMIRRELTVLP